MKVLTCNQTGQSISLVQQVASSGEGEIWQTDRAQEVAKLYYSPKPERIQKLAVMVAHPPQDPNAHINHLSFAWPTSLLQDQAGNYVGFLMPRVMNAVDLLEVYNPLRRQAVLPNFNWLYLHATAMNIASLVWAIHTAGYVLGDLKPQNILVNNGALPSIIDTDSFQVRHPKTGQLYRCPVGSEGFTPAELMDQDLATIEQTEVQDRFRLGVMIYLLLFGDHPFKGRWVAGGDSPDPNELLRQGWWPYASKSPVQPSALTMPLTIAHPAIQSCFLRCFNEGHRNPSDRPSAQEWVGVLKVAIADLKRCRTIKNHFFSATDGHCYWCTRKKLLGVDVFPDLPNPRKNSLTSAVQSSTALVNRFTQPATQPLPTPAISAGTKILHTVDGWPKQLKRKAITFAGWSHAIAHSANVQIRLRSAQLRPIRVPWIGLTGGITAMTSLLAISVWLSQANIEREERSLTLVGLGLCLGLAAFCFVLLRVTSKPQG